MKRNEVSYYTEIKEAIDIQLLSNFRAAKHTEIKIFWKKGELKKGLNELVNMDPQYCSCFASYAQSIPPLNLDIFGVITDSLKFEIIILEIKLLPAVGLSEWSQLIGYSLVSRSRYGILINIDNGASTRLKEILQLNHDLSQINTIQGNLEIPHKLGFMQWNSITCNFEYSSVGIIGSLSSLSNEIINDFTTQTPCGLHHNIQF